MSMSLQPRRAQCPLIGLLTLVLFQGTSAQCYLEDTESSCSVCWQTDSRGARTGGACPQGAVTVRWDTPLPTDMLEGTYYPVEYTLLIDRNVYQPIAVGAKGGLAELPHSNIHSCVQTALACTPFVSNTPGLSTHTPALHGNMSEDGQNFAITFQTQVSLPEESYTIIAHNRFFIRSTQADCVNDCLIKVDTAVGVSRTVIKQDVSTSLDAYVGTGVVALAILLVSGSIGWAAYKGKLNVDRIIEAVMREEVALLGDGIFSLGDIVAYTISFVDEIVPDPQLKDIVPAGILFLITGWCASSVTAWQIFRRLRIAYRRWHGVDETADTSKNPKGGVSEEGLDLDEIEAEMSQEVKDIYRTPLVRTQGLYSSVFTLVLEDIPLGVMGIYVLLNSSDMHVLVVLTLVISSVLVGIKVNSLAIAGSNKKKKEEETRKSQQIEGQHQTQAPDSKTVQV